MIHNGLNGARIIEIDKFYIPLGFNMFNYYLNCGNKYKISYKLGGIV